MFNVKWDYPIKKALTLGISGFKCENKEVMPSDSFAIADFYL